jgi:uncharacterized radical SAM superfamily Fe-S cluster-containing enzyme
VADSLLRATTSLCGTCKREVAASVVRRGDVVLLTKRCEAHGEQEVQVCSSFAWYEQLPGAPAGPPALRLPVLAITSACDQACPICYTHNRNARPYQMGGEELRQILAKLGTLSPERHLINLTGGEPTQHPALAQIVETCRAEGFRRVTVSTHGLTLAGNVPLVAALARAGARVILAFDSLEASANQQMLGDDVTAKKLAALELLGRHGVSTTLLAVIARGANDKELGSLLSLALSLGHVRSLELHPMTFTGSRGVSFPRGARIDPYAVLEAIERQSEGLLRVSDFVSSPLADPLCYQIAYLLKVDERWVPFTRFMRREDVRALLSTGLYLEPGPLMESTLREVIDRLWTGETDCEDSSRVLAALKQLVARVFDPALSEGARLRAAEQVSKAVYVHTHMDEETYDSGRLGACCVGMPEADGRWVPSCEYNVLVRGEDSRFASKLP